MARSAFANRTRYCQCDASRCIFELSALKPSSPHRIRERELRSRNIACETHRLLAGQSVPAS